MSHYSSSNIASSKINNNYDNQDMCTNNNKQSVPSTSIYGNHQPMSHSNQQGRKISNFHEFAQQHMYMQKKQSESNNMRADNNQTTFNGNGNNNNINITNINNQSYP